ncbi:MAG: YdiU family protein [Nevskia sp.]|nr:YdiU family protein [Nevskia sp.]
MYPPILGTGAPPRQRPVRASHRLAANCRHAGADAVNLPEPQLAPAGAPPLLPAQRRFASLGAPYVAQVPTAPLAEPQLAHFNAGLAEEIGLAPGCAGEAWFLRAMSGDGAWGGYAPASSVYAGHQFGVFVPQLGDGRAHLIAETTGPDGRRWELQLKGSGRTPFSRFADGRAVLRSSIREYLASEAMHALGIPTTRALCLVASSEPVARETVETGAMVCRVAPGFVRFGHFEFFYYRGQYERLAPLAEHLVAEHFPEFAGRADRHAAWLTEVTERTARLMARWQAVGFCHGVMNTDNFSALGLTLDYGPYGFMDGFDARHICNHTDQGGRYAYDQQPAIGHWNCSRLLQATLPLLAEDPQEAVAIATAILERFPKAYAAAMTRAWADKLGLIELRDGDPELINRFVAILDRGHSDFTRSFRGLAQVRSDGEAPPPLRDEILDLAGFDPWLADYRQRLRGEGTDDAARAARMNTVNPKYVLRNHLAQAAIEQAQAGDFGEVGRLMQLLRRPFDEQPAMEHYAAVPPPEAAHIEVSCSS